MHRWHISPANLDAARRWRDRCLVADGSILTNKQLWTAENLAHLDQHFLQNLEAGEGNFISKLEAQLATAPPVARQLAAEILWLLYLSLHETSMRATTKRLQIRQVWEWSGEPLPDNPQELGTLLEHGVANPGPGFQTNRWREFGFCIRLAQDWKSFATADRLRLVEDPWAFAEWLDSVPDAWARQFRHMLLYLLFPDHFERIVTSGHKEMVVRTLLSRFGMDPKQVNFKSRVAVDRALSQLRPLLEAELPDAEVVDYYEPPVRGMWLDKGGAAPGTSVTAGAISRGGEADWMRERFGNARVWVIAPGEGARHWPEFQKEGIAAIGWDYLGDLSAYSSYDATYEAVRAHEGGNPTNNARACWQFSHEMQPGDYVVAKQGRSVLLGYGKVTTEYMYDYTRAEYQHIRGAHWERVGRWTLPEGQTTVVKTLTDLTPFAGWLRTAFGLMDDAEAGPDPLVPVGAPPPPPSVYTVDDALKSLFLTRDQFTAILDSLARKKNLILEGAPGVGKTFVARRIAWALLGQRDNSRVEMVQFHQSYAYEDFVQGWRPGKTGFELRDGVFHQFCGRAAKDPENRHVFIIDEINRGNLSKVFGELMMLIEHDKRGPEYAVPLTYARSAEDRFSVPGNVYVLGMMNTADRSLAMVDYALRRRFAFVRLKPAFNSDGFADHLAESGVDGETVEKIVTRMTELNRTITDDGSNLGPGFEIGHSFFVPAEDEEASDGAWYERVVRQEIEPLLNEYWFDDPRRVEEHVARLLA